MYKYFCLNPISPVQQEKFSDDYVPAGEMAGADAVLVRSAGMHELEFDKDLKDKEVTKYLDVLVDGQYVDELHNPKLKWKGSSNQRVIDVQKSLKQNQIVLFEK